jgi:hypothetical protein
MPEAFPQYQYDYIFELLDTAFSKLNEKVQQGWEPQDYLMDRHENRPYVLIPLRKECPPFRAETDALNHLQWITINIDDDTDGGNPAPAPQPEPTTPPEETPPTVPVSRAVVVYVHNNDPRPTPVAPTPPPPKQQLADDVQRRRTGALIQYYDEDLGIWKVDPAANEADALNSSFLRDNPLHIPNLEVTHA